MHFHRTNLLGPVDVVVVNGIQVTSIPRTLLDLGAVVPYEIVELAVQDAVIRNLVTHEQLFAVLVRKIAIEGNGHRWHSTATAARRDMERRRSITASGWDHYEYGWSDVSENAQSTRNQLAAILAP